MFWLIETKEQLERFSRIIKGQEIYLNVIPYNDLIHPRENSVCGFYIKTLFNNKGYILTISHNESFKLDINAVKHVLHAQPTIYTNNKKDVLHYIFLTNLVEVGHKEVENYYTEAHRMLMASHSRIKDINRIIPLSKHFELNENLFSDLEILPKECYNKFFDDKANYVFNYIEAQGIKVDPEKFKHFFYEVEGDTVYTQYNLHTLTKRPANHFNNVNYAALNKSNGEREALIPRNDYFIDIDISAYHPRLLAKLIDYEFEEEDVHLEFSKLYGVSYEKAKETTFQQMYGGVFKQYIHLEFFKKLEIYTEKLWKQYTLEGYIKCPISEYKFERDKMEDMNPQKLLNYLLQNYETSLNVSMMWEMIPILNKLNTRIVMYTYDSFLFDFDNNEIEEFKPVLEIFKKNNLKVKYKKGINYNF